jgi:cyclic pyranopterin monophosphate synthase
VSDDRLTHIDEEGSARMVDVGGKPETERRATVEALVTMSPETLEAVRAGDAPKGDVLGTARIAGIQAAKRTADLIPLAHPLPLTHVDVRAEVEPEHGWVRITAEASAVARTGVELEAMTAATVAALTVYDMVKGIEQGVEIGGVALLHKSGGKTIYGRTPAPE